MLLQECECAVANTSSRATEYNTIYGLCALFSVDCRVSLCVYPRLTCSQKNCRMDEMCAMSRIDHSHREIAGVWSPTRLSLLSPNRCCLTLPSTSTMECQWFSQKIYSEKFQHFVGISLVHECVRVCVCVIWTTKVYNKIIDVVLRV